MRRRCAPPAARSGSSATRRRGLWRVEGVKDAGEGRGGAGHRARAGGGGERRRRAARTQSRRRARAGSPAPMRASPSRRSGGASPCAARISAGPPAAGRLTLTLDAGIAFGSGEHGSTRGCLRALELVAHRRPRRILDLGTGSGILAMAAARLLHRPVLAVDIEPWSVRVAGQNAALNGLGRLVRTAPANGWRSRAVRRDPRPTTWCSPTSSRARSAPWRATSPTHLAPGGTAILAGPARRAGGDGAGRASPRRAPPRAAPRRGALGDADAAAGLIGTDHGHEFLCRRSRRAATMSDHPPVGVLPSGGRA